MAKYVSDPENSLKEHIDQLWPVLTREPQDHIPGHLCRAAASYCTRWAI
jgi:neutral trehalase